MNRFLITNKDMKLFPDVVVQIIRKNYIQIKVCYNDMKTKL